MNRKDYEQVSSAIRRIPEEALPMAQRFLVARALANVFAADNNRFNMRRFFEACGVTAHPDLEK